MTKIFLIFSGASNFHPALSVNQPEKKYVLGNQSKSLKIQNKYTFYSYLTYFIITSKCYLITWIAPK